MTSTTWPFPFGVSFFVRTVERFLDPKAA